MDELDRQIQVRLFDTQNRIATAAQSCGRNPAEVRLVVVSKGQPVETVAAAIRAGVRLFGENYPEQALSKIQALQDVQGLQWHMIGHLQSRKAGMVVEHFHVLHSLDRLDLALKLERLLAAAGRFLPVLLEFNVAGEGSKLGLAPGDESHWEVFLEEIEQILSLEHLQVQGLMAMPPLFDDPELTRPYFSRLARLRDFFNRRFAGNHFCDLSMGTSADFQIAVQEGASYVRVGTAILGSRPTNRV